MFFSSLWRHQKTRWEWMKQRVLFVYIKSFFSDSTIIQQQQTRLITISLWVPLCLAFGCSFSWFSMPLKESNCILGISIHGFKVTLQENAGLSHNPLITYKKTTSSQNAEKHKYLTYMRNEFAGLLFILLSRVFLDLLLSS